MPNTIYLDHAATTPVDPAVRRAMTHWLAEGHANASALHAPGRAAARAVEEARAAVAALIGATPGEVIFTSGGTESINTAVKGAVIHPAVRDAHVITSAVEHKAVTQSVRFLEALGAAVTVLDVDHEGRVAPGDVEAAIRPETVLVSVMHGNNEIGTLQPVEEIGRITRKRSVLFHVDAVQTVGHRRVDVGAIGCDLLSLSAHKFYGPVGAGALFVRGGAAANVRIAPLLHGGFQEEGLRAGTLNTPAVVGLGAAACAATEEAVAARSARVAALRDRLVAGILDGVPGAVLQGPRRGGLPGITTFLFPGVEGEAAVIALDLQGIHVSTGSACTTGLVDPSHVLLAIGRSANEARGAVRYSLGAGNTEPQVDRVVETTRDVVMRLARR